MVMVKLKMRAVYKTFLSFIGLLILIASILGVIYLFYDKVIESGADIEVSGNLSINYVDGKSFEVTEESVIAFSITNDSDSSGYYSIGFMQVRGKGNYKLLDENGLVIEGELKSIDGITTDYISINAGETKLYTLQLVQTGEDILKGTLNIRVQDVKQSTFANVILKNISPSENTLTKVGVEIATENEGLIQSSDDIGNSYYFRGNVNNNYVSFGDMLWRIVRINGDGTVRIVLDTVTNSVANYYTDDNTNFNFEKSAMNSYLETWLEDNLKDYTAYIANSKYCSDIIHDDIYNYQSYTRIITNKIPTLNCLGDSFSNNIGLLSVDEVVLAGASPLSTNTSFYLYNNSITDGYYTMTGASGNESSINMFMIDSSGALKTDVTGNLYRNVRPVINLIKNIQMDGSGTLEDPYKMIN